MTGLVRCVRPDGARHHRIRRQDYRIWDVVQWKLPGVELKRWREVYSAISPDGTRRLQRQKTRRCDGTYRDRGAAHNPRTWRKVWSAEFDRDGAHAVSQRRKTRRPIGTREDRQALVELKALVKSLLRRPVRTAQCIVTVSRSDGPLASGTRHRASVGQQSARRRCHVAAFSLDGGQLAVTALSVNTALLGMSPHRQSPAEFRT